MENEQKLSTQILEKKDFTPVKAVFGSASGYEEGEVEDFLEEMGQKAIQLEEELQSVKIELNKALNDRKIDAYVETAECSEELSTLREKLEFQLAQNESMDRTLKIMYRKASETHDEMVALAKKDADSILSDAETESQELMKKAQNRHDEIMKEVRKLEEQEKNMRSEMASIIKKAQNAFG